MRVRNVLVWPAGTEVGLEIHNALKHCKEVRLFGVGLDNKNHGSFLYESYEVIPSIYTEGWVESLVELCCRYNIEYIFPAYDDIVVALSRNADRIPAKIVSSPLNTCEITRSKRMTYNVLRNVVPVPLIFEGLDHISEYPVCVKPDRGQGSFGVSIVDSADRLISCLSSLDDPLICEYLPGDEYTVDCLSDRQRGLLFAGARIRGRMRNGIAVNSRTVDLPEAHLLATAINSAIELHGAWFFQVKRNRSGELVLLEVAPRIAGSMATHRMQGVNFPLLSLFEVERQNISVLRNPVSIEIDRALGNRYRSSVSFSTLYIDLDDTLIVQGRVNTDAVKLIYQSLARRCRIILLTRHAGDLEQTLFQYRLHGLFDEIIHIVDGALKSNYVTERDSIFVDDSFSERSDISRRHGILTFDCSMIEALTNCGG